MGKLVAVMLDGGHLRVCAKRSGYTYDPDYIEKIGLACVAKEEEIYRILYYDCAPYKGEAILPVSGQRTAYTASDKWLHDLARKDLFAVRRGVLKFRGFVLKKIPYQPTGPLQDSDFAPHNSSKRASICGSAWTWQSSLPTRLLM